MEAGTAEKSEGRGKKRLFAAASLLVGILFALLILEVGLRIAGYSSPEFYAANTSRGYALIPGMTGTYSKEGRSHVTINREGFRDVEHTIEKPKDTVRIAVVGDSYVEALQVERDEAFTNYVSKQLEQCGVYGPQKVEMLNFGVSGYGTVQELVTVREQVLKYSPDVVILVMTTNNDITDNSPYFKRLPIPYLQMDGGSVSIDTSFTQDKVFLARNSFLTRTGIWLKNHLRFVQAIGAISTSLKYRYREWKDRPAFGEQSPTAQAAPPVADVGTDNQIYREPNDDDWRNAWAMTEAAILEMKKTVEGGGARLMVVTASNGVQVLPDVSQRQAFAKSIGVEDLLYPDRRIADFGSSASIPVITLAPALGEYAVREKVYLHGFDSNIGNGHWNQLGHKIAGETIGQRLCEARP